MPENILIIDDEEQLRKLLTRIISLEGFQVTEAGTLKDALEKLKRQSFGVVLCDVRLPDGNGVDFITTVKQQFPSVEMILLTAFGNIPDGVQAIKNGAFDYLVKGNDNDRIIPLLNQAVDKARANQRSAIKVKEKSTVTFESIIGDSDQMKEAIQLARKIAATDANVLLLGETGTGKEVFASAIYAESRRSQHAFVAINCSAFPKDLLENELFGHKAGAFTGATKDKKGLIEVADRGTLFLDEISEMHIDLQAKILRVIEAGEFIKVGDEKISRVNVRIIAAGNRDLNKEIELGHFRKDLYYRLNVFSIELRPLRERAGDIPALASYFLFLFGSREGKPGIVLSQDAVRSLQRYSWPGNIRELRNVMERAVILSDENQIRPEDFPYEIQKQTMAAADNLTLSSVEKRHIETVLRHTKGNKTKAAAYLGIGLTTLYRKIEEYNITSST